MLGALKQAPWRHLRSYVSTSFFDVLPAGAAAGVVARISRNAVRTRPFRRALGVLDAHAALSDVDAAARLPRRRAGAPPDLVGGRVLRVFFAQVLGDTPLLLDLRPDSFAHDPDRSLWSPAPVWIDPDPEFRVALRGMYRGFYAGDLDAFDGALAALDLGAAREPLLRHFGGADQRAVVFDLGVFHDTFHDVFVACRDAGARLHPDFVSLGLLLATMYETLEALGMPLDVRAAFDGVEAS